MNSSHHRAVLLQQQGRYAEAEREWRLAIGERPADAGARAMLATCLLELGRAEEATAEAREAVGLAPDSPVAHYTLGHVLLKRDRPDEALVAVDEAIRLDPYDADAFALLAAVRLEQRRWPDALAAADQGLAVDPSHAWCTNLRAMALVQLGRKSDAARTIDRALEEDPENALTHANQGWALLHAGDHRRALDHFRESLRLQPGDDWAKAGLVEAMKARNVVYRLVLRYFLFMSRLSGRAQWGIIIGLWVGQRLLSSMAKQYPATAPFVWPVLGVYVAFVLMTWLSAPLFNLLLRFDRYGRYALSADQRAGANVMAACLLAAGATGVAVLVTGQTRLWYLAIGVALLIFPASAVYNVAAGWPRLVMAAYAGTMALAAVAAVGLLMAAPVGPLDLKNPPPALTGALLLTGLYLLLFALTSWVGNGLAMVRPKR